MSFVRLTIPGEYWDSQIYRGTLYLFERSGSILTLDWAKVVDGITEDEGLKLAARCAFKRSDYLYRVASTGIFHDPEFKNVLFNRFQLLGNLELQLNAEDLRRVFISRQDNKFPFPHSDCLIYSKKMYVSSTGGLYAAGCGSRTKHGISTRLEKLWDGPALSINASYGSIALALGDDGLWEYDIFTTLQNGMVGKTQNPKHLANRHCSDCNWAYYSIFGSSTRSNGFLAAYRREEQINDNYFTGRRFVRLIDDDELFSSFKGHGTGYSWAAQDKICQASNGYVSVVKYKPWADNEELKPLGSLNLPRNGDPVISARIALFGTIVELPDKLEIIPSEGPVIELPGEPVAWRVFPRSHHYENHLHIIHDDHLEILSFNHDYFVDQNAKLSGISARRMTGENIYDSLNL